MLKDIFIVLYKQNQCDLMLLLNQYDIRLNNFYEFLKSKKSIQMLTNIVLNDNKSILYYAVLQYSQYDIYLCIDIKFWDFFYNNLMQANNFP
jgi:hypothetical protein